MVPGPQGRDGAPRRRRDPTGHEPDDFFFTTDLQMSPQEVVEIYAGRWSIELC